MPDVPETSEEIRAALVRDAARIEAAARRDLGQLEGHRELSDGDLAGGDLSDLAKKLAEAAKAVGEAARRPIG